MISTCPTDIASWSDAGDSFIVKDVGRFTEEIIPTVYKHNKFPSFVRQLNFYGFRKVRADTSVHSTWWEFKHPLFRRGEPHLLVDIKKSVHFAEESGCDSTPQEEIADLRKQVSMMNKTISEMRCMIDTLMTVHEMSVSSESAKKRKTASGILTSSSMQSTAPSAAYFALHEDDPRVSSWEDLEALLDTSILSEVDADESSSYYPLHYSASSSLTANSSGSHISIATPPRVSEVEELTNRMISSAFMTTSTPVGSATSDTNQLPSQQVLPGEQIASVLRNLPLELQGRFVERLADVLGDQLAVHLSKQVGEVHTAIVEAVVCEQAALANAHAEATPITTEMAIDQLTAVYGHVPVVASTITTDSSTVKINVEVESDDLGSEFDVSSCSGIQCSCDACRESSSRSSTSSVGGGLFNGAAPTVSASSFPLRAAFGAMFSRLRETFHRDFYTNETRRVELLPNL